MITVEVKDLDELMEFAKKLIGGSGSGSSVAPVSAPGFTPAQSAPAAAPVQQAPVAAPVQMPPQQAPVQQPPQGMPMQPLV